MTDEQKKDEIETLIARAHALADVRRKVGERILELMGATDSEKEAAGEANYDMLIDEPKGELAELAHDPFYLIDQINCHREDDAEVQQEENARSAE